VIPAQNLARCSRKHAAATQSPDKSTRRFKHPHQRPAASSWTRRRRAVSINPRAQVAASQESISASKLFSEKATITTIGPLGSKRRGNQGLRPLQGAASPRGTAERLEKLLQGARPRHHRSRIESEWMFRPDGSRGITTKKIAGGPSGQGPT